MTLIYLRRSSTFPIHICYKLIAIKESLDYQDDKLMTCHGWTTLLCKVLKSFESRYLNANNHTYKDNDFISKVC